MSQLGALLVGRSTDFVEQVPSPRKHDRSIQQPCLKAVPMRNVHTENHLIERAAWLRVAMSGANDGLISTAMIGSIIGLVI